MSLLPSNAKPFERALEASCTRVSAIPARPDIIWQPDLCPEPVLPWLAWALSVDEWDENWTTDIKRQVIKASIAVHLIKGTLGAVKKALAATGVDTSIKEWFQYGGQPYTFKAEVNLENNGITRKQYEHIRRLINRTKNTRSHFDLTLYLTNKTKIPRIATACLNGQTTFVRPYLTKVISNQFSSVMATGSQTVYYTTIAPQLTTHLHSCICRTLLVGYQTIHTHIIKPRETS
ncbi:phage tail protein I [Zooshikella harenae]|uniref:Phage tail protein I n=1 Tax=Zooshikella harenae TaxID=2827238 RepID=A0ABS5ZJY1_9GAMM|nr:phage tail protein I [Zooshikella harenae]MBU2714250.1 phage tail protein I [Zooshikella harenae]